MKRAFEVTRKTKPGLTTEWSVFECSTWSDTPHRTKYKDSSGLKTSVVVVVEVAFYHSDNHAFATALSIGMTLLKESDDVWLDELGKVRL